MVHVRATPKGQPSRTFTGINEGGYFVALLRAVDSALRQRLLQLFNLCLGEGGVVSESYLTQTELDMAVGTYIPLSLEEYLCLLSFNLKD